MLKKVAVELPKGIKKFGKPIRNMEINTLNIRQIFDLLRTHGVKKVYEYNDDETKRIVLNIRNYADITDFSNVEPFIVKEDTQEHKESENEGSINIEDETPSIPVEDVVESEKDENEGSINIEDETPSIPVEDVVESEKDENEKVVENSNVEITDDMTEEELEALIAAEEAEKENNKQNKATELKGKKKILK